MSDESDQVDCAEHGKSYAAFICEHLGEDPVQRWHGNYPSDDDPWPPRTCSARRASTARRPRTASCS